MSLFSREELKSLIEQRKSPCVSISMPTHRFFSGAEQDKILLVDRIKEARNKLKEAGVSVRKIRELMAPVEELRADEQFWKHQRDGLAIYINEDLFRYYRVPMHLDSLVEVDEAFHVRPLLLLLAQDKRFYVLALSQKEVKLFQCTRFTVDEVQLEDIPKSLSQVIQYDGKQVGRTHFHSTSPSSGGGQYSAVFHGWGGFGEENAKAEMLKFFYLVNRGVNRLLSNERVPLVVAAVDYLIPIYREANAYPYLFPEGVQGSPEGHSPGELHRLALAIIEPYFNSERQKALQRYQSAKDNWLASSQLLEIIPAAYYGRVEILFSDINQRQWGIFDPDNGSVTLSSQGKPGVKDLHDLALVHTLLNGGDAFVVEPGESPDGAPLAAVFRY